MEKLKIETHVEEAAQQAGGLLRSRYGLWALAGVSFIESALVVPLITDPFLIAYILADRRSVIKGVVVTVISSVLGGIFAYALAFLFYEYIVAQYLIGAMGDSFLQIIEQFKRGVFLITLTGAITPIPYTLVALGAGFLKANFLLFVIASLLGRGLRYGLVGFITYKFGEQALVVFRKNIIIVSIVLIIAVVVFFIIK